MPPVARLRSGLFLPDILAVIMPAHLKHSSYKFQEV
jgi:hypothetical protein